MDSPFRDPTSSYRWFLRGFGGGIVLLAAFNALSYFFLSDGWWELFGMAPKVNEALGFPFIIWDETNGNGIGAFNESAFWYNVFTAFTFGLICGWIATLLAPNFNKWVIEFEEQNARSSGLTGQFSVKSMLILIVAAAIHLILFKWSGSSLGLSMIFLAGPTALIGIAMLPDNLHWKVRSAIVAFCAFLMISIAVYSAFKMDIELEKVLLGFYVCWVPQCCFAVAVILLAHIVKSYWFKQSDPLHPQPSA